MGLSLRRVLGIAAVGLAAACTPASAPAPTAGSASAATASAATASAATARPASAPTALPAVAPTGRPAPGPPPGVRTGWGSAPPVLRIMPLGDSITYGVGSTDGAGYRARLERRLTTAGIRVDFVGSRDAGPAGADDDNEGHSGWTISRMARRVDRWFAAYRPDVVLLHIGTNDVRLNGYRIGAAKRLGVLLNRIRRDRPAAHIFVAKITGSRQPGLQRWIAAYNAGVARIVAARDDPLVRLVDQAAVRAPYLHPNDAGYAAMADTWFTALTAAPALRAAPALSSAPAPRAAPGLGATPAPRATAAPALSAPALRDLGVVVGTNADTVRIRATTTPRSRRHGERGTQPVVERYR